MWAAGSEGGLGVFREDEAAQAARGIAERGGDGVIAIKPDSTARGGWGGAVFPLLIWALIGALIGAAKGAGMGRAGIEGPTVRLWLVWPSIAL